MNEDATAGAKRGCPLGMLVMVFLVSAAAAQDSVVETCRLADTNRTACAEGAPTQQETDVIATEGSSKSPAAEQLPKGAAPGNPEVSEVSRGPDRHAAVTVSAREIRLRNPVSADVESGVEPATGLRVAEYSEVPYQRLQIELENGQIWRQVSGDQQHLRVDLVRNQTVDIDESGIGAYQLRLNELQRTIPVERIR